MSLRTCSCSYAGMQWKPSKSSVQLMVLVPLWMSWNELKMHSTWNHFQTLRLPGLDSATFGGSFPIWIIPS